MSKDIEKEMQDVVDQLGNGPLSTDEAGDAIRKLAELADIDLESYTIDTEMFLISFLEYLDKHFKSKEPIPMNPNVVDMLMLMGYSTVIANRVGKARADLTDDPEDSEAIKAFSDAMQECAKIHDDCNGLAGVATQMVRSKLEPTEED